MKVLIVAATVIELIPVQQRLEAVEPELDIYSLITGVGMIATAFELTTTLNEKQFDLVINIGIAGAFDKTLALGEVVEVVQDQFSEELVEDGIELKSYYDIGLRGKDEDPFENGVLNRTFQFARSPFQDPKKKIREVNAITVNTIHGNDFSIMRIRERLNPEVETMEGAAFFYVCNKMEVPCLQLRAISNYVEKRNRDAWEIELAITNLAEEVVNTLNKLV
jgi:futalosine hydrolase